MDARGESFRALFLSLCLPICCVHFVPLDYANERRNVRADYRRIRISINHSLMSSPNRRRHSAAVSSDPLLINSVSRRWTPSGRSIGRFAHPSAFCRVSRAPQMSNGDQSERVCPFVAFLFSLLRDEISLRCEIFAFPRRDAARRS